MTGSDWFHRLDSERHVADPDPHRDELANRLLDMFDASEPPLLTFAGRSDPGGRSSGRPSAQNLAVLVRGNASTHAGLVWGTRKASWSAILDEFELVGRRTLMRDRAASASARPLSCSLSTSIVVEPLLAASLVHACVGHTCEADNYVAYGSTLGFDLGDRWCGAPGLTFVDDPTVPGQLGSFLVDDEGTPAQRTVLVADGRWQNLLTSCRHCPDGFVLSGNGRVDRMNEEGTSTPRNSVLIVEGGSGEAEDLLGGMVNGYYCGGPRSCLSIGRNVVADFAWAERVRDGRLTGEFVTDLQLRMRKGQLLHELRTPVALIKGYASTLRRDDAKWDKATRQWNQRSATSATTRVRQASVDAPIAS